MLRLLRLPGALSPPLSAGTSRACSSRCSVYEARHRIFGASLSRDPRPYKSLKNLQHAGGFIGPKVAAYYPKPHPLMRHPVFRMALNEERLNRIEINQKMGKAPPKKGEGKRSKKKK
mmetsp:Transcript_42414/g.137620  ORF Transcript_42414/g.137620 Transcript_42414/m.137620 type:complete len:117 (+) Transcript_42414:455-805(+)